MLKAARFGDKATAAAAAAPSCSLGKLNELEGERPLMSWQAGT